MGQSLSDPRRSSLPVKAENLAQANLRKAEIVAQANLRKAETPYLLQVGRAVERARRMRGWTNDEFAGKCAAPGEASRDPRQVAKWQNGKERPHFDVLFAIDDDVFKNALVIALAALATGVEIDTVIRLPHRERA